MAGVVHQPQDGLRNGDALLGSQPVPLDAFSVVLRDAIAVVAHQPQIEPRKGVSLLVSRTEFLDSLTYKNLYKYSGGYTRSAAC